MKQDAERSGNEDISGCSKCVDGDGKALVADGELGTDDLVSC